MRGAATPSSVTRSLHEHRAAAAGVDPDADRGRVVPAECARGRAGAACGGNAAGRRREAAAARSSHAAANRCGAAGDVFERDPCTGTKTCPNADAAGCASSGNSRDASANSRAFAFRGADRPSEAGTGRGTERASSGIGCNLGDHACSGFACDGVDHASGKFTCSALDLRSGGCDRKRPDRVFGRARSVT
jgi:hypothetical protein